MTSAGRTSDGLAGDPFTAARASAARLAGLTGTPRHDAAVVLGSGWAPAADALTGALPGVTEIPVTDLGGFAEPTVGGHRGTVRSVLLPPARPQPSRTLPPRTLPPRTLPPRTARRASPARAGSGCSSSSAGPTCTRGTPRPPWSTGCVPPSRPAAGSSC